MFEQAIKNQEFKDKFGSTVEDIKKNWYLDTFNDMNQLANSVKSRIYYMVDGKEKFNWFNSQNKKFVGQFY